MEIKRTYNLGFLIIQARINDGFVVLTTNQATITKQIYHLAKKQGRNVIYNERTSSCVEYYEGLKAQEIEKIIDGEVVEAKGKAGEMVKKFGEKQKK